MSKKRLSVFIRELEAVSKRSKAFKRKMLNNARKIELFEKHLNKCLYTDSFSDVVLENYLYFLKTLKPYRTSTMRSFGSKLKEYTRKARAAGYKINTSCFDVELPKDDYVGIALTKTEVRRVFELEGLDETQHNAREWFVFGCCTGLRHSDLKVVSEILIGVGHIRITTTKTKNPVVVPLHHFVSKILKRNNYKMPNFSSIQYFNKTIKKVCEIACIDKDIRIERFAGLKFERTVHKKYELVSSHTARRTFATNAYLAGIKVWRIMLITGHKTEQAFFSYICIDKDENADFLSKHKFFTGEE